MLALGNINAATLDGIIPAVFIAEAMIHDQEISYARGKLKAILILSPSPHFKQLVINLKIFLGDFLRKIFKDGFVDQFLRRLPKLVAATLLTIKYRPFSSRITIPAAELSKRSRYCSLVFNKDFRSIFNKKSEFIDCAIDLVRFHQSSTIRLTLAVPDV